MFVRTLVLMVTTWVIASACHSTPPRRPGEEYLASVKFEGNKKLKNSELMSGLALHRTETTGGPPDPYRVENDADRLRGQYQRSGFFEIDVQPRIERKNLADTVTFKIAEGARSTVRVRIEGLPNDPEVPEAAVRARVPMLDGAPFVYQTYDDAKASVLGVLQDAGYARATLEASVEGDLPSHTATIVLEFAPGPKCKFGKIVIEGVAGEMRDAIINRLHFQPGQPYSTRAVTQTQRDIYEMNRFSSVQVQPDNGSGAEVNMHVAVSESAAHQITLGGGFGIDPLSYEVRARAGYQVVGWPFPLDTVTLDFRPAYAYLRDGTGYEPRVRALARLERQDLFFTHAKGSIEVGYTYLAYEAFTEYGPEGELGYEIPLGTQRVKLRLGYQVQQYSFNHPSVLIDKALQTHLGIDRSEFLGAYEQALVVDFRDHPVEPRWGIYGELKLAEGGPYAGGSYSYQELVPEVRGYVPIGPIELAARARYGQITGAVPPTERFYAGGAASNRGFSERMLSPSVTGQVKGSTVTVPYGGAGMIDTSLEARIPITTIKQMPLHGVVFLDGGEVTDVASQLKPLQLDLAAGLGLRLLTVVGPVRADFGYRLNHTGAMDPQPLSKYAFHLSLGEAF
jgi:translocation and assembly module TamA